MPNLAQKSLEGFLAYLAEGGVVSRDGVQRVQAAVRSTRQPFDIVITELGLIKEAELAQRLSKYLDVPIAGDLDEISLEAISKLGYDYALHHGAFPLRLEDDKLHLALANPFDRETIEIVAHYFDVDIAPYILPRSEITGLCNRAKRDLSSGVQETVAATGDEVLEEDIDRLQDIALSAPVVNLVSRITQRAFEENATDIHIEPLTDRVQIRLRKDGLLVPLEYAPKALHAGISSRVKILSKLNIVERRMPQDGRMRLSIRGQEVDFRVSVVPSAHGETIALRLLHNRGMSLDLAELGYEPPARRQISSLIGHPNGIVIITGPTGSGKTTTLYSLVSMLNRPEAKIFTVEDPVEYRIDGVTQLQVNPALGLDFAKALRSILRQDPDIILVGEIRDKETAQIAIQAALTGHLVLTTLHTNSAAGALTRLTDMGVEPYLIAATVRGIVGQRLVRTYCRACAGETEGGATCQSCSGSKFSGRTVAYEILDVSPDIAAMVNAEAREADILLQGQKEGMVTLADYGRKLVADNRTSAQEVARAVSLGVES
jgi:general secretion pathway protein E